MDRNEAEYQPALIAEANTKVTCCYRICCFSVSIDGKSAKLLNEPERSLYIIYRAFEI